MRQTLMVLLFTLPFFAACTKKNTNEIVIGHFGSMTGSEATFGQSTDEGIRLAVDEANATGGIKGKKIKLITMDDQGKPEEAASVVTRLIEQEKVVAILGEVASSRSLAAAPIAQAKKIPMMTPSSTNPKVTQVGDYIFRACFIDPFQGTVMAKFATDTLKAKKVAVLRDVKSDYSVGLADFFIQKFKELGGEIVADLSYQSQDVDFKAQLTQMKSKNPDAIYIPGYYTEVGLIARQTRELGIKATLMGGDGWDSPKLFEIGKSAVNGGYFSNHYSTESKEPAAIDFMAKFKEKYKRQPDGLSSVAYDATKMLLKAIENTTEITPTNIRDQLAKIKEFVGATGKISIDENRNAVKSAVVVKVQGNENKYVTTVNP
ncbi:MAG: ethanolamine utilization protein EutJ [Bdellovibrio sp. CG10_big_fil_rev_8_21_14_0_10_47_8]|nr:MAG: ethanolamine utilization protein EutJ [Bdellovibrio sp. CG10_big_fil_rev_8_21_14_0_10_47_8]